MWQSWVEIEHYSVAYLDCVRPCPIRYSCILAACMSPALNGSFALQHFECGNAVEMYNGIMIDFYPGLPHMYAMCTTCIMDSYTMSFSEDFDLGELLGESS